MTSCYYRISLPGVIIHVGRLTIAERTNAGIPKARDSRSIIAHMMVVTMARIRSHGERCMEVVEQLQPWETDIQDHQLVGPVTCMHKYESRNNIIFKIIML